VVTSQYRTMLNFTPEALGGARSAVRRLDKARAALLRAADTGGGGDGKTH
jgi:cysteinyl-tRNA synthetase